MGNTWREKDTFAPIAPKLSTASNLLRLVEKMICLRIYTSKLYYQSHEFSQHLGQKPYECRKGCGYASAHLGARSAHENRCLGQGVPRGRRKKAENLRSGSADRKKFDRREAGGSDVQRAFNIRDIKREWPET